MEVTPQYVFQLLIDHFTEKIKLNILTVVDRPSFFSRGVTESNATVTNY